MLVTITYYGYEWEMDVKMAFLNSYLKEDIFIEQPRGFESSNANQVCKLKRSIYGFK